MISSRSRVGVLALRRFSVRAPLLNSKPVDATRIPLATKVTDEPKHTVKVPLTPSPNTPPPVVTEPTPAPTPLASEPPIEPPSTPETTYTIPPPPPPPRGRFRRFLIGTVLLGSAAYGAGIWYSLRDDDFHDLFVSYAPLADRIVTSLEEREFQRRFEGVDVNKGHPSKAAVISRQIPEKTVDAKVTVKPGSSAEPHTVDPKSLEKPKLKEAVTKATAPKPSAPVAAATGVPATKPSLPLIHIPQDINPLVASSVDALNHFIQSVNTSSYGEEAVGKISKELSRLSHEITALKKEYSQQMTSSLESQAKKFSQLAETRDNEFKKALTQHEQRLKGQVQEEHNRILKLYNERLLTEIEATKKVVVAHANNRLVAINGEREKQFAQEIAERVDKEREGRLANIKELAEKVERISALTEKSDGAIAESDKISQYHIAVTKLVSVLKTSSEPVPLRPYLESVAKTLPDDALVTSVISNVPEDVYEDGVLTQAQLTARFRLLVPELRKASLLPPGAGVAGHVGSWIFSNLLAAKSGNPVGDDDESVFARAETALVEGRIVDAVAEVNSLKGWPKTLAADWLAEGRKRSEVAFLVQVLADEGKLWSQAK